MSRVLLLLPLVSAALLWAQCESASATAEEALRKGDLDKAEEVATKARAGCPRLVLILARVEAARAELLAQAQDYPAAERAIRKSVALNPNSVSALLLEGDILGRQGRERDAEAEQALRKASALAPDNPAPYFRLGVFLDSRGRREDAVANFRKVVARDPGNPTAWQYLALNLEQLGRPDEAEAAYQQGLAVNHPPRVDPFLPYNYGKLLLNRNRLAECRKYLDQAAELLPDNGAVFYQRARLNVRLEKYAEARADAERVLALPDPLRYTYEVQLDSLLATIYARLGENELAEKYAALARSAREPDATGVR